MSCVYYVMCICVMCIYVMCILCHVYMCHVYRNYVYMCHVYICHVYICHVCIYVMCICIMRMYIMCICVICIHVMCNEEVICIYALSGVEVHVWMMWILSFAKEPYKRDYILQKRPIIFRRLLIRATSHMYEWCAFYQNIASFIGLFCKRALQIVATPYMYGWCASYLCTRVRSSLSCEIDTERYCRKIVYRYDGCTYTYTCIYTCTYR